MRTAPWVGGIAGALLGIAIVTSGSTPAAGASGPRADPSGAPASVATTTAPPPASPTGGGGGVSPIITLPSGGGTTTTPAGGEETTTAPASVVPTRKASAAPSVVKSPTGVIVASPTATRFSPAPVTTTTRGTTTSTQTFNNGPVNNAPAPTNYAATDGGKVTITSFTPGANGSASPVVITKTARTTKRLGHFSVTDLLLVLILSAGGVAIAGAGGLWVTRR